MSSITDKNGFSRQKFSVGDLFQDRLSFLEIRQQIYQPGWKRRFTKFRVQRVENVRKAPARQGGILVFSNSASKKLILLCEELRRQYLAKLNCAQTALLIFCQSEALSDVLKKQLSRHHLAAAVSLHDENLLASRLKAIIREKIQQIVERHGVALEIQGQGILISGANSTGKTETALQAAKEGGIWIADDLVVIRKLRCGNLVISGHQKIKNLYWTKETGIAKIDLILNREQIKKKARLDAVIEVSRAKDAAGRLELGQMEIMDVWVPQVRVGISRAGFFNCNLLARAINKLRKEV